MTGRLKYHLELRHASLTKGNVQMDRERSSASWREILLFVLKFSAVGVAMTAVSWAAAHFAYLWYQ